MLVKQHTDPPHALFAQRLLLYLSNAGYPTDAETLHRTLLRESPGLRITLLSVKNWLSGRTLPRPHSIQALSSWLKIPPSMLVFGEQDPKVLADQLGKLELTLEAKRVLEGFMALRPHHRHSVEEVIKALNCLQERESIRPKRPPP